MARPSKNQIAAKKKAKQIERRNASLDAFWEQCQAYQRGENNLFRGNGPQDECEVACEGCGLVQLVQNPACVVCGGSTAVFRNTITM